MPERNTRLLDGEKVNGGTLLQFYRSPAVAALLDALGATLPSLAALAPAEDGVPAEVNHGRWIVRCPQPRCAGAGSVWIGGPHQFFCVLCGNYGIRGLWRPILLPDARTEIEDVLTLRRMLVDRNWLPVETVDDLLAQNVALGYDVPPEMKARTIRAVSRASRARDLVSEVSRRSDTTPPLYSSLDAIPI